MRVRRSWVAPVLATATVAGLGAVGVATATAGPKPSPAVVAPVTGATFNNPTRAASRYALRDQLVTLVNGAPTGSLVSFSMFHLNDNRFADAVLAASRRGVRVRAVFESSWASTPSAKRLVAGLGSDRRRPSWALVCGHGCIGSKINHNKFYLFSSTGGARHVVVQSSANVTPSNATSYWNNSVTLVGNTPLYNAYLGYFTDLAARRRDSDYYRTVNAGDVKAYFFPRAGSGAASDTVYNALSNVACTGNRKGMGTADGRTVIRVGMWGFSRVEVARRLAALGGRGCVVQVVSSVLAPEAKAALRGRRNVSLRLLPEGGRYIVHSKYLLVEGGYGQARNQKVTFTGSHNLTRAALRLNDETMLRIDQDAVHDQYRGNFGQVWAVAG